MDGIITCDERGIIQSFSQSAELIFGYSKDEAVGQNVSILMPEPHHSAHDNYIKNYLQSGIKKIIGSEREVEAKRKDGSVFPLSIAISDTIVGGSHVFTGILRDITTFKEAEEVIRHLANYDALTDLPGRRLAQERAGQAITMAQRYNWKTAYMYVDLDGFKEVNDTLGHDMGDVLLKEVAERFKVVYEGGRYRCANRRG